VVMKAWFGSTRSRPTAQARGAVLVTTILILAARSTADTLIPPSMQPFLALEQHLVFSPWTKVCQNSEKGDAQRLVCFTSENGRTDSGTSFVAAVLIDTGSSDTEKILRITLPLGVRLADGTWIAVDQDQPMTAPYIICITLGCVADYQASNGLIDKLRAGKYLVIKAVNGEGQLVSFVLPLFDFSKAYDGPPTYRKILEDH
jgi:invasion protein IalB